MVVNLDHKKNRKKSKNITRFNNNNYSYKLKRKNNNLNLNKMKIVNRINDKYEIKLFILLL